MASPERLLPAVHCQPADPTLALLEAQLIEAERVELVARQTIGALGAASAEQRDEAYGVLLQAREKRQAILRLIDAH
jgi:hypothetical protein